MSLGLQHPPCAVHGAGVFMRTTRPIQKYTVSQPRRPLQARSQAYDTLTLTSPGETTFTVDGVIAHWIPDEFTEPFALLSWDDTDLPFYVVSAGVRYALNLTDTPADVLAFPYSGQTLAASAIFELWGIGSDTVTPPDIGLRVSFRTQLCCDVETPTAHTATLYSPYRQYYPVTLPIWISPPA